MNTTSIEPMPAPSGLPATLPPDGAINLELIEGVVVFRVASAVQERIETLLEKERAARLTAPEADELTRYEEIDDYLSFLNRLVRNLAAAQAEGNTLAR
jgi:hypothetical protein